MIKASVLTSAYRCEPYLERFLQSVLSQIVFDQIEIVFAHNESSAKESNIAREFLAHYPEHFRYLEVQHLETLAASWNRCIRNARGNYVCIWNVDDLRTPDSLEAQIHILDTSPEISLVYGDMVLVKEFGMTTGVMAKSIEFVRDEFMRSFNCSAFPMWRKSVHEKVGWFDEQLRSGADFDFVIRVAAQAEMKKEDKLLGYFTNAGSGLSTRGDGLQPIERTVIELRYGIYDKIDYRYIRQARKYKVDELFFDGSWHPVSNFIPNYKVFMKEREHLRPTGLRNHRIAQVKRFFDLIKRTIKNFLRALAIRLGLYKRFIPIWRQNRWFK